MNARPLASVLMCHAPVAIPEIAGKNRDAAQKTTSAMKAAASFITTRSPDVVVIASPHTPRLKEEFVILKGDRLTGDFADFEFSDISVSVPSDQDAVSRLIAEANKSGIPVSVRYAASLDQGALVPLYFMKKAGWTGKTIVIGFPGRMPLRQFESLGRVIRTVAQTRQETWAFIASGDTSHRLAPGSPAGYDQKAHNFDDSIVLALREGRLADALDVDPELRKLASEDVVESLAIAYGTSGGMRGGRVLSYESPFGVGYLVAILCDPDSE